MGSLADRIIATDRASVPTEWQARSTWDGEQGDICTGPIVGAPLTDFSEILKQFGYDPELVEIPGKVNQWRKQQKDGTWLTSYFFGVQSKRDHYDLPALYQAARRKPAKPFAKPGKDRVTVVVLSDLQIGKVGRRGGTPELLERIAAKRAALADLLKHRNPTSTVLLDAGDGFENFNSGGNPMFTNDLSLTQQMDCYGTEIYQTIDVMQRHGHVDVANVPSNHTAWRLGKQQLGRPSDDLGLFVHDQVRKVAEAAHVDAAWSFPAEYDESVAVKVMGTVIGLVHGNQFGPGQAINWWEKQTFGAQSIAAADVLITGHYHTFGAGVAGRNPVSGKQRWWLGAPTLDNGSDWYRQTAGRDSDPGLLVFDVDADGFNLGSMTVL